jgi:D-aminoacyl-tRNA deacylase
MRAVIQRVTRAEVRVGERTTGRIGNGLLVLIGIAREDTLEDAKFLANKILTLRIFDDESGRMNCSLADAGGSILCVSQFTLYGDCRKGRRSSYGGAAAPSIARPLYEAFVELLRSSLDSSSTVNHSRVETGEFQAMMQVESVNDGPVTLLLDSEKLF